MATQFLFTNEVVGYIREPKAGSLIIQLEVNGTLETTPAVEQWDVEQADAEKNDATIDIVTGASLTTPGAITVANNLSDSGRNPLLPSHITAELTGGTGAGTITIAGTIIDELGAEITNSEQVLTYTSGTVTQRIQTARKIKNITSITVSSGFSAGTFNLRAYGKVWSAVHSTNRNANAYTGLSADNRTVTIFCSDRYDYRIRKAQGTLTSNTSFSTATWDKGTTELYR